MIDLDILGNKIQYLTAQLNLEFDEAPIHSKGFVLRVLGECDVKKLAIASFDFSSLLSKIIYGGFPPLACLGFGIGQLGFSNLDQSIIDGFFAGLDRLKERSGDSLHEFLDDDIAILGVVDGINSLDYPQYPKAAQMKLWLNEKLNDFQTIKLWSNRIRDLARDMLDNKGRLQVSIDDDDSINVAVEISLRNSWPYPYRNSHYIDTKRRQELLKSILLETISANGDIELTCIKLKSLNLLVDETVKDLLPTISDVVRLLERTQHSFKRWVWDKSARNNITPSHWLIDNEHHVQSFLWAVLYPVFGQDLVDEKYLPDFGQVQPRFDLGIIKHKLIIEVKVIREVGDFAKIEEEVAGDLGLYFKETNQFDRMVVYAYDDCNQQYVERYDALRTALRNRERIEDVIIIGRPSMIPSRKQRKIEPSVTL